MPRLILKGSLVLAALTCGLVFSQSGGRITGTITDNTGASVADATVEAINLATGETRQAISTTSGVYVISPLAVGNYRLQARKEGFKLVTRPDIRVDVNSTATIDIRLEVGNVTETITVQSQAATIETENATVGNSRYETQLKQLPVIVREVQTLVGKPQACRMATPIRLEAPSTRVDARPCRLSPTVPS